jgi:hypothetical protein
LGFDENKGNKSQKWAENAEDYGYSFAEDSCMEPVTGSTVGPACGRGSAHFLGFPPFPHDNSRTGPMKMMSD